MDDEDDIVLTSPLGAQLAIQNGETPVFDLSDFEVQPTRLAPHIVNAFRAGCQTVQLCDSMIDVASLERVTQVILGAVNELQTAQGQPEISAGDISDDTMSCRHVFRSISLYPNK